MICCRICIDDIKKPVSLPCDCAERQTYTHLHPCPICRSIYNIAPINFNVVPPNLRPFVTPNIRKVYLDTPDTADEGSSRTQPTQPPPG
ncbi:hypothetical protein BJ912DRAFT_439511 [Pholiota molesta]|nr:hypothetical protein BJ912DRAFT_439511 [Pholiota molesta]